MLEKIYFALNNFGYRKARWIGLRDHLGRWEDGYKVKREMKYILLFHISDGEEKIDLWLQRYQQVLTTANINFKTGVRHHKKAIIIYE